MESNKLEISGRVTEDPPPATYKQISESDVEENIQSRPKSLVKSEKSGETDGADEKMLPSVEKAVASDSKIDVSEIQFTTNEKQNGEMKLDIDELKTAFVGMGKEELLKYANDPFWVRIRWILFVGFWLLWLGMLVGAILIIIAAPKCAPPTPRTWWEQGPLVEVDNTFSIEQLSVIKERKIPAVIISNPGDSYRPLNDSSDTLNFIENAKEHEINVIVELEPISSSIWFEQSEQKIDPYTDYYIWAKYSSLDNGTGSPVPPNNWLSPVDGSSAWTFSKSRQLFYYAPHSVPHLNFRNPAVIEEFSSILRDWVDAGANGIRLRGTPYLLVDDKFEDESPSNNPGTIHTEYQFFTRARTYNVDGIGEVVKQWRTVVNNHNDNNGPLMVAEDLYSLDSYIVNDTLSIDLPQHSKLFLTPERLTNASLIYNGLQSAFTVLGDYWPLWQYDETKNHSLPTDVLNMVTMVLPGTVLFSNDETLIDPKLMEIRQVPSVMFGSLHRQLLVNDTVIAYLRVQSGNPGYLVACNPSDNEVTVDLTTMQNISNEVTVKVISSNFDDPNILPNLKIPASNIKMPAKSAIIVTYVPKKD